MFERLLHSDRVREILTEVRAGNVKRKVELPAFIFGGVLDKALYEKYTEECRQRGEKPRGSRAEQFLKPTGLFMMDFDRSDGDAYALYEKFVSTMLDNDIETNGFLALAHRTAKGHGLRLVLKGRQGSTIEADQHWVSELMDEPIDEVCKDFSRLSYCPCDEDVFSINPEMLFGTPFEGIYEKNEESPSAQANNHPLSTTHYPLKECAGTLDAKLLVKALEEQLGGAPRHGSRNSFIFAMACHLTHVFGNDPEAIAALVPTYGEDRTRWRSTIESACRTAKSDHVPDVLHRALKVATLRQTRGRDEVGTLVEEPPLPKILPPLLAHLTCKVPTIYKPSVAMSVFPALGAHLSGVTFRYIDNVEHEPTFMCVLMAKMSSGKSCVNKPIDYILADIVARDAENRQREQEWKTQLNTKGANKEKPKRPDNLCIQVLVSDMTNAAFVQRLADAGGKFLYTTMDEIELLDQLKTSARSQQVSQIIRLAFDCGYYGQERVGSQSVTAKVRVRWNWNASTTIGKGQSYFRHALTDGTLSRLSFCTINTERGSKIPVIGTYDKTYGEVLRPYIDHLNEMHGEVHCPEALALVERLLEETERFSDQSDSEAYEVMSYRAVLLAYLRAMTLYVAHGCEWSTEIEDFVHWSLQYDLWCKMRFFGVQLQKEIEHENQSPHRGPQNMLALLPPTFTTEDVVMLRRAQGRDDKYHAMINNWIARRYISPTDNEGVYQKIS